MYIALVIAPQDAQASAFVVFRDRLETSIDKAARLGYDGIELALAASTDVGKVSNLRACLDQTGMAVAALSTGRLFAEKRVWLTHSDAEIRQHAVDELKRLVDLAHDLGTHRLNIGRVRGPIDDAEGGFESERRFFDALRTVADYALPSAVNLVVEPVNRYEINFINSVDPDGIDAVSRIGRANVKLMPDVFHMNIEDASIAASLVAAGDMVGYVHLADSNRHAPGEGHTDFHAIFGALSEIGYDDWVGVEILPIPDPDSAAATAIANLRTFVPREDRHVGVTPIEPGLVQPTPAGG